jgi:ribosomal protein L28
MLTGKRPSAGNNKPKTLHKTRRVFKPNVQRFRGLNLSTEAIRIIKRAERLATPAPKAAQA